MKKSLFSSFIGMAVLSFVFFSACEIGLGSSVDVEAPKIEFADTTVESGAVVRDAFAVHGKWSDDGSIGSLTATLKNLSTGADIKKNGTMKDGTWTVAFSPADEAILDGPYELSVVIKDTADHESKISRAFTIDNTPPLVVLSRPSTKLGATLAGTASFDSYGQKFTLEGKAADDNDVSLIEVQVYDNAACSGAPLKTISLPNVPLTIESDVAEYSSTTPNDYAVIYGHVDASGIAQRNGGDSFRYCKLVVYDGAQRYPADGSAQTEDDKKGNSVDHYYLNSDISGLFTEGYKITELYHILNGTYTGSARTTSPDGVISLLNSDSTKVGIGQFKINPENSPKFVVSAKNTLPVDNNGNINIDFSDSDMPYFITNGNGPLEIEVTPGLDGHLIQEPTIGVYLLHCNDQGALLDSNGNVTTDENQAVKIWLIETGSENHALQADITQSGSTYKFKTKSSIGTSAYSSLGINNNYYICVTGRDEQNNKIISDGKYGFRLTNTSQNIDVSTPSQIWYSSNESASNSSKNPSVTLTFSSLDYLPVNLYRGINQTIVGSSSDTPKQENIGDSQITNNQLINSVPASEFSTHPQYLYYKVVSTTGTAQSNQKRVEVKYDNTAPTATLPTSGIPNATATEQPTFTIQGTAADNTNDDSASYEQSSGVKEVYIQIWDGNSTTPSTTSTPAYSSSATAANQAIKASYSEGSWIYTIKPSDIDYNGVFNTEGPKTIKVTAVDGVGLTNSNQTPSADYIKTFQYDKSLPTISFTSTTGSINPTHNSYRNSGFTLEVNASDDNGIEKVSFIYNKNGTSTTDNVTTTNSNGKYEKAFVVGSTNSSAANYLPDGTYEFTVRATDNAGKIKDVTRTITVDTTSPTGSFAASNPAGSLVGSQRWYKTASVRFAVAVTETNIDTITISDGTNNEVMSPSGDNYAASLTELNEGSNTITVTMLDKAGNSNTTSETVYVDLTAPALNVTNNLQYMPDAGFTVNGTAEDSGSAVSGIDSLIVKEEHRTYTNGSWSAWASTAASGTTGVSVSLSNGNWSRHLPLGTNVTPQDGEYRYTFTLKDKAGNSTTNSFTTSVDKSAPVITINTPSGKTATNAINSSPYMFSGHIEEPNSIAAIYYKYLSSTATAPSAPTSNILTSTNWTNADWTSVNAEENWSFYKEINTSDTSSIAEGIYTLYMYALDGAGNLSTRQSEVFHVDMAAPEVTASAPDYVNATTNANNSNSLRTVAISGTVTESHGLQSLYIKRNDESGNGTLVTTTSNGNGTYSFTYTNTPDSDGTYTYTITATDKVGKTGNRSKIVVVDTVAEITQVKINNSVVAADADISSNWYKAQAIPVNVVVGDSTSGSGVASVEYATLTATQAASASTLGDSNWTQLSLQSSGYGGSAIFSGTGRNQKLYIRVKDNAGNTTYFNTDSTNSSLNEYEKHTPVLINIDTTAPVVGNTFWYQFNENGTAEQSSGQIYVDGTKDLYVYGRSYDTESGLSTTAPLTFTIGENTVIPYEIKYAVTEPGTNQNMTNLTYNNVPSDRRTIKYWKAKFTKDQIDTSAECGTLKVKAKNAANDESSDTTIFNITFDNTAPVLSNISFASTNLRKQPYKSSETLYFVNNKDDGNSATTTPPSFTIRGIATDNVGVADVTLTIGTAQITRTSTSLNEWEFANINLSSYAENATATATITVTDVSGHSATKEFTIKFDTTAPKAMHWADAKGKDIYFRIGNADNDKTNATTWETGDTVNTANESKNTDVGKKYSYGSWGNDSTIEIRGYFKEATEGSGLKTIHYAIFDDAPSSTQISNFVAGTLTVTGSAKVIGSFEPLATPVEKNVPYNKTTAGAKAAKEITTNFRTQLPGFNAQNNYLVLVAEDNAGNRAADTLVVTEGKASDGTNNGSSITNGTSNWNSQNDTATPYYSINKDTQAPNITPPANTSFYTNGAGDNISISGTASDGLLSGIDNVTVTIEEISFEQKITSLTGTNSDTWTATVPVSNFSASTVTTGSVYTVYAKATDKAGIGNSKQISAGTIIVDKAAPTLAISTPASNSKVSSSFTLTGTVSDGTGSGINTSQGLTLYYTTNSTAGASAPTAAPASGASASNTWVAYSTAPTLSENGQEWSCSVNLASLVPDLADTDVYFSVSATDLAGTGNTGYSAPRMVTVDRKAPVYDSTQTLIGGRTVSQLAANVWFNTETLVVSGAFTDGTTGSGVESIIYQVDSNTEQTIPTTDGSFNTNISGFTANSTLKFKAKDKVGNDTDYHPDRTFTIKVDTGRPTISEVNTDDFRTPKLTNKTEAQTLTFYVTDPFPTGVTAESANAATSISKISTNAGTTSAPGPVTVSVGNVTLNTASNSNGSSITIEPVSGQVNKWLVTVTVGTADLNALSGNNPVLATVSDNATNQSASTTIGAINIDDDDPEPSFTSHQAGATVNKTITLSGRVTDPSSTAIKSIALTATSGTNTKQFAYPAETGKETISYVNGQWSATLDTTQLYNGNDSQALSLSLAATDVAENTSAAVTLALTIDQNSDRPVVKFTNLVREGEGTNAKYILKYGNAAALEGTVTDDDATSSMVVKTFYASSDPITSATATRTGTTTFNAATGDYTFTPASDADGAKTVYFYIVDNKDNVFYTTQTTQLTRPYKQYKTDAKEDNAAAITYNSDSNAPVINSVQLQAYTAATANMVTQNGTQVDSTKNGALTALGTNCVVGGTSKNYVDLKVSAKDANGIKGIVIKVEQGSSVTYYRSNNSVSETGVTTYAHTGTVNTTTDDTTNHVYTTSRINITSFTDGQATVTVKVYDNSGLYNNQESVFMIDRNAPTLSIDNNVADNAVVYGINKITIGGSVTATDVDKIYYAVTDGDTESESIAATDWHEVEGQKISASIIFAGTTADEEYGMISDSLRRWIQTVYSYDDAYMTAHDDNKELSIHFKAVDTCGNAGYSNKTLSVVPNGDKPVITLSYPVDKAANVHPSLAGTIRIYGNAEVITGSVRDVYVQIDTNYNGTTFNSNWLTGFNTCIAGKNTNYTVETIDSTHGSGIKATGTLNWNLPINGAKEFNPTGTSETRSVAIRIYGVGGSGKVSEPVIQEFTIDPNAPHIGGTGTDTGVMQLKLVQFDSSTPLTAAMTYTQAQAAISNQMPYIPGQTVWVKGQWYIAASIYDDSGISSIKLDENIPNIEPIYLVNSTTSGAAGTIQSNLEITTSQIEKTIFVKENDCHAAIGNVTGKKNFDVYIPLPTSAGSGNIEFTLEAVEASEFNNGSTETVKVNFDNTPPKLGTVGHDNYNPNAYDVKQDNGFYRIFGYATDAEGSNLVSDLKAVAFYFVRRGTGDTPVTKVYDPMWKNKFKTIQTGSTNTTGISYEYGMFWNSKTVGRSSTDLSVLTLTTADDNIHAGGFVLIGGTIYTIRSVSDNGLTITLKTEAPAGITTAKFAYAMVIDNFNMTESVDTRSKITNSAAYGYGYYGADSTADDGDLMQEKWASGKWEAWINSNNIPDGPIEIHYVALDNAQNYSVGIVGNLTLAQYQTKTTLDVAANGTPGTATNNLISGFDYIYDANKKAYVSNNAPRIAGVIVGTDYNGNGTIETTEKQPKYVELGTRVFSGIPNTSTITKVLQQFNASSDGTASGLPLMKVVDKTSVEIEIIGGNNEMYYRWNTAESCNPATTPAFTNGSYGTGNDSWQITRATGEGYKTDDDGHQGYYTTTTLPAIEFSAAQLQTAIGGASGTNGTRWWTIQIWDSTEETTHFVNSQYAELKLPLDVQVLDQTPPNTVVSPLFWKSASENSVYHDDEKSYGHVEIKGNDIAGTSLATAYGATDDKVSGTIVFRGYAYDNKRLSQIDWAIVNSSNHSILPINATGISYTTGATYANGNWTGSGTLGDATPVNSTKHYKFTVKTEPVDENDNWNSNGTEAYLDEKGHKVYWELIVDTSAIDGTVAQDAKLYVRAKDASGASATQYTVMTGTGSTGSAAAGVTDQETIDKATKAPTYQVDIVPYITGVETALKKSLKTSIVDAYTRTTLGHYIVREGEEVTFTGYNLAGAKYVKTKAADQADDDTVDLDEGKLTVSNDNITTSSEILLKVGSLYTINNMNNNNAKGTYTGTISDSSTYNVLSDYAYNRMPNNKGNNLLTDDVYFDVWQFDADAATPVSGELREPAMKINPVTGKIGVAFVSGPADFSMPMGKNTDADDVSWQVFQHNYATFSNVALCYDSLGNSYATTTGLDTYPNGNKNTLAGRFTFQTSKWGVSSTTEMNDNYNYERKIRLEAIGLPGDSQCYVMGEYPSKFTMTETRFYSPSIVATTHGTDTSIYLAYYDSVQKQIRFRYGSEVPGGKGDFGNFVDNEGLNSDLRSRKTDNNNDNRKYVFEANTNAFSLIAGVDWQNFGTNQNTDSGRTKKVGNNYFYDTTYTAQKYVSIDAIQGTAANNDKVVAVWYDGANCRYAYTTNPTSGNDNGPAGGWDGNKVIFTGGGEHCAIKVGPDGSIHIAANVDGVLKYAYLSSYDAGYNEATDAVTVDSYAITGEKITIDVGRKAFTSGGTTTYKVVPYISYYLNSAKKPAVASLVIPSSGTMNYKAQGTDSNSNFTGNWDVSLVPVAETLTDLAVDKINVALWKKTVGSGNNAVAGVITSCTDDAFLSKDRKMDSNTVIDGKGYCSGNGTENPVIGYAIVTNSGTAFSLAQRK